MIVFYKNMYPTLKKSLKKNLFNNTLICCAHAISVLSFHQNMSEIRQRNSTWIFDQMICLGVFTPITYITREWTSYIYLLYFYIFVSNLYCVFRQYVCDTGSVYCPSNPC